MKGENSRRLLVSWARCPRGSGPSLLKALSSAKKPDGVIHLIDAQFDASPRCGHCG